MRRFCPKLPRNSSRLGEEPEGPRPTSSPPRRVKPEVRPRPPYQEKAKLDFVSGGSERGTPLAMLQQLAAKQHAANGQKDQEPIADRGSGYGRELGQQHIASRSVRSIVLHRDGLHQSGENDLAGSAAAATVAGCCAAENRAPECAPGYRTTAHGTGPDLKAFSSLHRPDDDIMNNSGTSNNTDRGRSGDLTMAIAASRRPRWTPRVFPEAAFVETVTASLQRQRRGRSAGRPGKTCGREGYAIG
jgi:hypothetical protein